jgi:accessory gene regulator B
LAYVIEAFTINLLNITVLLLLGYLFDVLPEVITVMVIMSLLRFTAGGAHSNSPWRCALVSAVVFLSLALIAPHLSSVSGIYLDMLGVLAVSTSLITVICFAPVDSISAPIISAHRRKKLKVLSLLVVLLITVSIIILRYIPWAYASQIQAAIILSALWGSFNLTRIGQRLMDLLDEICLDQKKKVH